MPCQRSALVEALTGRFDDHHGELARILLGQVGALLGQVGALTIQIEMLTARIETLIAAILQRRA